MEVDFVLFIAEALASNKRIKKHLDNLYEENKYAAYKLASCHPSYNHPILTDGSIEKEVSSKRAFGLFLLARETGNMKMLEELYKKGWPEVLNHLKKLEKSKKSFRLEYIHNFLNERMSDDEFNGYLIIAYIMADWMELDVEVTEALENFEKMIYRRTLHYKNEDLPRFGYETIKKNRELFEQSKKLLSRIREKYGRDSFYQIDNIMAIGRYYQELEGFPESFSVLFDSEDVMLSTMTDQKVTEKDLMEVIAAYYTYNRNFNRENAAKFLIEGIIIKKLIQSFKEVKKFHFENNKETMFFRMEDLEKKINNLAEKNRILIKNNNKLQQENDSLRKDYKNGLEAEIIKLNKELKSRELLTTELEEYKKEVAILRNSLYDPDEEIEINNSFSIPSVKCLIIGGHVSWQDQLRKELPDSFSLVSGDGENKHLLDHIAEYDYVIFKVSYLGHPAYVKVIEKIRKSDIKFGYLTRQTNIKKTLREIEKIVK